MSRIVGVWHCQTPTKGVSVFGTLSKRSSLSDRQITAELDHVSVLIISIGTGRSARLAQTFLNSAPGPSPECCRGRPIPPAPRPHRAKTSLLMTATDCCQRHVFVVVTGTLKGWPFGAIALAPTENVERRSPPHPAIAHGCS